ncbi:hypothetical protein [Streptomyces reniochalinae]|uniref:hypothetical protein n=1 Tax=Streptomyces reniochalinae TaxID=2250578 RepID=UPI0015EFE117
MDPEGSSDGDEVVDVTAATGLLGTAEGGGGQGPAERSTAVRDHGLGQSERSTHTLDIPRGMDTDGAEFNGSFCHDR